MEDLFPALIVIIGSILSIVSSSKKAKEQKAAEERRKAAAAARVQAAQERIKATAKAEPARPALTPTITPAGIPGQVITPTVHAHLQPDCDVHDKSGSLDYVSSEGKDYCHEAQLTHVRTPIEEAPQEGGLTFDWSGDSLVKAFVMQEVLTRPCERRAR